MIKLLRHLFKERDGRKMYKSQLDLLQKFSDTKFESELPRSRDHNFSFQDVRLTGGYILNDGVRKKPRYNFERRFLKVPVVLEWLADQLQQDSDRHFLKSLPPVPDIQTTVFHEVKSDGTASLGFRIHQVNQDGKKYVGKIYTPLIFSHWILFQESHFAYLQRHEHMIVELATGPYTLSDPDSPMVIMDDFVWHVALKDQSEKIYRSQTIALVLKDVVKKISFPHEEALVSTHSLQLKYRIFFEILRNERKAEIGSGIFVMDENGDEQKIGSLWMHTYFDIDEDDMLLSDSLEELLLLSKFLFWNITMDLTPVRNKYSDYQSKGPLTIIEDDRWIYEAEDGSKTYYDNLGLKEIYQVIFDLMGEVRYRVFYSECDDETTMIGFMIDKINRMGGKIKAGRLYLKVKYVFSKYRKDQPLNYILKHEQLFNRTLFGEFIETDNYKRYYILRYKCYLMLSNKKKVTYDNVPLDKVFKDMEEKIGDFRKEKENKDQTS